VLIGGFGSLTLFLFGTSIWVLAELSDPTSLLIINHLNIFSAAAFPLALGYSILRHRLWGVDALVNRTLVFGGLILSQDLDNAQLAYVIMGGSGFVALLYKIKGNSLGSQWGTKRERQLS